MFFVGMYVRRYVFMYVLVCMYVFMYIRLCRSVYCDSDPTEATNLYWPAMVFKPAAVHLCLVAGLVSSPSLGNAVVDRTRTSVPT